MVCYESLKFLKHHCAAPSRISATTPSRFLSSRIALAARRSACSRFRCSVSVSFTLSFNSEGCARRAIAVRAAFSTLDVTDRIRAEQALRQSEQRFRLLADTALILIWMSDRGGGCVFLNRPWLEFTGKTLEEQLATAG
jgi:PAS domain-containing protein